MNERIKEVVEKHWNTAVESESNKNFRTRWWEYSTIIRHINQTICGEPLDGWNAGAVKLLQQKSQNINGKWYKSALSIGCGEGTKEMLLLKNNLVQKFICFDLAEERIIKGKEIAEREGLQDRIEFLNEDFLRPSIQSKTMIWSFGIIVYII